MTGFKVETQYRRNLRVAEEKVPYLCDENNTCPDSSACSSEAREMPHCWSHLVIQSFRPNGLETRKKGVLGTNVKCQWTSKFLRKHNVTLWVFSQLKSWSRPFNFGYPSPRCWLFQQGHKWWVLDRKFSGQIKLVGGLPSFTELVKIQTVPRNFGRNCLEHLCETIYDFWIVSLSRL